MRVAALPVRNPSRVLKRIAALAVAGIGLYIVWPSLIEVFSAWPELSSLDPWWLALMFGCEAASFAMLWLLMEISLGTNRTLLVATSQLSSNAVGRVMPGGTATASALQYRLLVNGGLERSSVAAGLTATQLIGVAVLSTMPLLALPAIVGGSAIDRGLLRTAIVGVVAFALVLAGIGVLVASDRALAATGRAAQAVLNRLPKRREPVTDLPVRLIAQRNAVLRTLGQDWWRALIAAGGRTLLDYFALLCALSAVGANPRPGLVVLAYVVASLLGMIPITPGGLGFVEAGLTGTLTLAGVSAPDAVLATLAYRLASYWVPLIVGGLAYGGYRFGFRRRKQEGEAA